jgi:ABC-type amino acid transport substrate-binding protein
MKARAWIKAWTLFLGTVFAVGMVQADESLSKVKTRGVLTVAVYKDFFPYSEVRDGGIDVDLAGALANRLGVKLSLMPFDAGESLDDDLRNMVWKGHYLGYGPADVMLHVPIDPRLEKKNDQVLFFSPYQRESVKLALNAERIPQWNGMDVFSNEKIAVDGDSISALVMLGADGGRYRENVINSLGIHAAIANLKSGNAAALMATRTEIEAGLGKDPRFYTVDIALPGLPPAGWTVGMAVASGKQELAKALAEALDSLVADGTLRQIFANHGVTYNHP